MGSVRPAAVAGAFYPGEPRELDAAVHHHLAMVEAADSEVPKAIIAPHAGYVYSGTVAASAYVRLRPAHDRITRVVLLGPCHRVPVRGLALSGADAFATPLGDVRVDADGRARILDLSQVQVHDAAHGGEHSLEVHLPFLQVVLDRFSIVPLVVGDASADDVAEVMERLWGGPETLIVVSTDLSHFLDYDAARRLDGATCDAIEKLEPARIGRDQACGRVPVRGLLTLARRRGLAVTRLDVRNSGDTAGPRDRVVGYGSWMFLERAAGGRVDEAETGTNPGRGEDETAFAAKTRSLLQGHGATLLHVAAASIEYGLAHGKPLALSAADHTPVLRQDGACFVTLERDGKLRGCIGTSSAHRPLVCDVADNAFLAAFRDRRFSPLTAAELDGLALSISVLSAAAPMTFVDESDLLRRLRPGTDGLIIEDKKKRALFLPSVWETLPTPVSFVQRLKKKAGLAADHWSDTFQVWRFIAEETSAADLDDPASLWSGIRPA